MNRQASPSPSRPPPPPPKAKEESGYGHLPPLDFSSPPSTSRYVDGQLADAIHDSVQIGSSRLTTAQPRRAPSPAGIPRPSTTYLAAPVQHPATSQHHRSSSDMSGIVQPQLPSKMMAARNPFEEDEVEPVGQGRVRPPGSTRAQEAPPPPPTRQKLPRSSTV